MRTREFKTGRVVGDEEEIILLRDDDYRIWVSWISGKPSGVEDGDEILWAEYKHCDMPYVGYLVAELLMVPNV